MAPKPKKRGSPQLQLIFKNGKRCEKDFLALYWMRLPDKVLIDRASASEKKVFLIVGKRALRLAHDRNRAKRLLRELYRAYVHAEKKKYQWAIRVARPPGALTLPRFKERFDFLMEKALGKIEKN